MKDLIERADELEQRTKGTDIDVGSSIKALVEASKYNRRFNIINAFLLVAVVLIGSATIIMAFQINNNSIEIAQNRQTLINNCAIGNEFRTTEKSLWNYILSIPSEQTPTPEQQLRIDSFKSYLDKNFALRDCSKI